MPCCRSSKATSSRKGFSFVSPLFCESAVGLMYRRNVTHAFTVLEVLSVSRTRALRVISLNVLFHSKEVGIAFGKFEEYGRDMSPSQLTWSAKEYHDYSLRDLLLPFRGRKGSPIGNLDSDNIFPRQELCTPRDVFKMCNWVSNGLVMF
jgi:hypothetical protein